MNEEEYLEYLAEQATMQNGGGSSSDDPVGSPGDTSGSDDTSGTGTQDPETDSDDVEPIDPILAGQKVEELLADPLLRSLYFGSEDQPGFFNQLLSAGRSALEGIGEGLGMYLPFLQRSQELGEQAFDPVTGEDISRFMDPYEDLVVQKALDDATRAFDQSQIAQKARAIGSAGLGAFGSRFGVEQGEDVGEFGERLGSIAAGLRSAGLAKARDDAYREKGLLGQGAQFQQGLASLYPQFYFQDVTRPLGLLGSLGQMLPGYKPGQTLIKSDYGIPQDPSAGGLGAAFNLYSGLAGGKDDD